MTDQDTTIGTLKRYVIDFCRHKGWGKDGIQNPQHVAMAMMVEACEVLEHFQDMTAEEERALLERRLPGERQEIAEEIADVVIYGLQNMFTLDVDVSKGVSEAFSDDASPICRLKEAVGAGDKGPVSRAMHMVVTARFLLKKYQWLSTDKVQSLIEGGLPETRKGIGEAFVLLFREVLMLTCLLDLDLAGEIARKIAIVDRRAPKSVEPAR